MNDWREDAMDEDRETEPPAASPEVEAQGDPPEPPVMLTDAMCGLACQVRPEPPPA
jgi:hypothetical protein